MTHEGPDESDILAAEAKRICEAMGFDSIQIIATCRVEEDETKSCYAGHGNWHSRYGAAVEMVKRMEHYMTADK